MRIVSVKFGFRAAALGLGAPLAAFAIAAGAKSSWSQAAQPTAAEIALTGVIGQATPACASCHGMNGEGERAQNAPRLAGLDAQYLERQLNAYRSGARASTTMGRVARSLHPGQVRMMADYYAGLPAQAAEGPGDPALLALGRQIAEQGDWSRNVPPCASCHGATGLGVGSNMPPIAGQRADYLMRQLTRFRTGARANDPLGLMRTVAAHLSAREMQAVSAYYAALPVRPAAPAAPTEPKPGGRP